MVSRLQKSKYFLFQVTTKQKDQSKQVTPPKSNADGDFSALEEARKVWSTYFLMLIKIKSYPLSVCPFQLKLRFWLLFLPHCN